MLPFPWWFRSVWKWSTYLLSARRNERSHGRVPGDLLHPRLIRMNGDPGDIHPADLNLIEMAFAKLKQLLRSLNAKTIDQLWLAIGSVCSVFTPDECWSLFRHCGYVLASS